MVDCSLIFKSINRNELVSSVLNIRILATTETVMVHTRLPEEVQTLRLMTTSSNEVNNSQRRF